MPWIAIVYVSFFLVPIITNWNITAVSKSSTTIHVQWPGYPDLNIKVFKYMAICISKDDISAETTDGQGRNVELARLMRYSEYTVQVLAFIGNLSNSSFSNWNETIKRSQKVLLTTLDDGEKRKTYYV
jgi:hypothetical protein